MKLSGYFNEISLGNITSFIAGAYTFLLINYFWFDNRITVPGVSALIASMSLLFTIYAVYLVKSWSGHKMNDKAFKHAENTLESANECYLDFVIGAQTLIELFNNRDNINLTIENPMIKDYMIQRDLYKFKSPQLIHKLQVLKIWKYQTNHLHLFKAFVSAIGEFDNHAVRAINELRFSEIQSLDKFKGYSKQLTQKRDDVLIAYQQLMSLTFDSLFVPTK